MEIIKIREDRLESTTWYECDECGKTPSHNDVIIETEINYHTVRVCCEECLLDYLRDEEDCLNRKRIVAYKKSDSEILLTKIESINSNEKLTLECGTEIHYFNIEGMIRHYIVKGRVDRKVFFSAYEVARYISK